MTKQNSIVNKKAYKEKPLSEKEVDFGVFAYRDVAEAVKKLKEDTGCLLTNSREQQIVELFREQINKIFGSFDNHSPRVSSELHSGLVEPEDTHAKTTKKIVKGMKSALEDVKHGRYKLNKEVRG